MRSVADEFRAESQRRVSAMTAAERLRLAFELGEADVALLQAARSIGREEARRLFARARQHGRTRSVAARP
jgi:hypothetical protein